MWHNLRDLNIVSSISTLQYCPNNESYKSILFGFKIRVKILFQESINSKIMSLEVYLELVR